MIPKAPAPKAQEPKPQRGPEMEDQVAILRELLTQPQTHSTFEAIISCLKAHDQSTFPTSLDYARAHLKQWTEHAFVHTKDAPEWASTLQPEANHSADHYLEICHKALQKGTNQEALDAALSAWRRSRHPDIGALVNAIDERLPSPPMPTKTKAFHQRWLEYAAQRDHTLLGFLWRTLSVTRQFTQAQERAEQLEGWCDDPRSSEWILRILRETKWSSNSAVKFYKALFGLFPDIKDPRLTEVRQLPDEWDHLREGLRGPLVRALKKAYAALPDMEATPLTDDQETSLKACTALLQGGGAQQDELGQLWAAVYEDLQNDAPLHQLAASLKEYDDPRGELISLQLLKKRKPPQTARIKELLKLHLEGWLGECASVLKKGVTFSRGLPHKAKLARSSSKALEEVSDNHFWRSIESLECHPLDIPAMSQCPFTSLKHLTIQYGTDSPYELSFLSALTNAPFAPQLETLIIQSKSTGSGTDLWIAQLLRHLLQYHPKLHTFTYKGLFQMAFHSKGAARLAHLSLNWTPNKHTLERILWKLPSNQLRSFTLGLTPNLEEERALILLALGKQDALETCEIEGKHYEITPLTRSYDPEASIHCNSFSALLRHWYPRFGMHPLADRYHAASFEHLEVSWNKSRPRLVSQDATQVLVYGLDNITLETPNPNPTNTTDRPGQALPIIHENKRLAFFLSDDSIVALDQRDERNTYRRGQASSLDEDFEELFEPEGTREQAMTFSALPHPTKLGFFYDDTEGIHWFDVSHKEKRSFTPLPDEHLLRWMQLSPKGRWLVASFQNAFEKHFISFIWDTESGKQVYKAESHIDDDQGIYTERHKALPAVYQRDPFVLDGGALFLPTQENTLLLVHSGALVSISLPEGKVTKKAIQPDRFSIQDDLIASPDGTYLISANRLRYYGVSDRLSLFHIADARYEGLL